jgi:cupin 2 domain-containing protein
MNNNKFNKNNIFDIDNNINIYSKDEIFDIILNNKNIKIERIISSGQRTNDNEWLVQDKSEWVLLLQGEATIIIYENKTIKLSKGDYLYIPENTKHKVDYTSKNPHCIWLAIHF